MGGDAAIPGGQTARSSGHKSGNASWIPRGAHFETTSQDRRRGRPRRRFAAAVRAPKHCWLHTALVQHLGRGRVNPDASRLRAAPDSARIVGRALGAPAGCSGRAGRPRAAIAGEPTRRIRRCSRSARGRSACRYARACRNARRRRSEENRAPSVGTRPTNPRQAGRERATLTTHCACHGGGHGIRIGLRRLPGAVPGSLRRYRRPHSAAPTSHSRRRCVVHRARVRDRRARAIDQKRPAVKSVDEVHKPEPISMLGAHPPFSPHCC
jgi:hypothetical protein